MTYLVVLRSTSGSLPEAFAAGGGGGPETPLVCCGVLLTCVPGWKFPTSPPLLGIGPANCCPLRTASPTRLGPLASMPLVEGEFPPGVGLGLGVDGVGVGVGDGVGVIGPPGPCRTGPFAPGVAGIGVGGGVGAAGGFAASGFASARKSAITFC